MMNWMSQRGKNSWLVMIFCFTTTMPTVVLGIYIASELPYSWGWLGLVYAGVSFSIILVLWMRYFDKREKSQEVGKDAESKT